MSDLSLPHAGAVSHYRRVQLRPADRSAPRGRGSARNRRIFDLWLACWTQQEIADDVGLTQQAVLQIAADLPNLVKLDKPSQAAAEHATWVIYGPA